MSKYVPYIPAVPPALSPAVDPNPVVVQKAAFWAKQAWVAILAAAGALEVYGVLRKGPDDTLTETTRWLWRTDTPVGKWAFRLSWIAFAAWFGPHIVKLERQHLAKKS